MKKLLLSAFVIGLFIIYGLSKQESANNPIIVPVLPTNQNGNTDSAPTSAVQGNSGATGSNATPTPTQAAAAPSPTIAVSQGQYKDGTYTGSVADAFYGNIQVQAVVSGGKITDVIFLQYPNDRSTSIAINTQAMPYLKQEAIAAQSANVAAVSGASDTSAAFQQSLQAALSQAH